MTREQKLQAVVDAAREWASAYEKNSATWSHVKDVNAALAALDAHTEVQARGKTVTLAVWANGMVRDFVPPEVGMVHPWRRLGTVTLPLDQEGGR